MIEGIAGAFYYMAQLICACLLFAISGQKRPNFFSRLICGVSLLALVAILWGLCLPNSTVGLPLALSSICFLLSCVPFIWACLDITILEAAYCTVCAFAVQHTAFGISRCYEILQGHRPFWEPLILVITYFFCYFCFIRHLSSDGKYFPGKSDLLPMSTILLFAWVLSVVERTAALSGEATLFRLLYQLSDMLCCCYVLWAQASQRNSMSLQRELDGMEHLMQLQKEQYQVTQETIEVINRKCHDLQHQLRNLRNAADNTERSQYFQEMEDAIMIYDTAVQTGNIALDIILMEKGLYCQGHQIQWTCMVDGAKLDFMQPEDIYAMFGNALDNAITAVLELDDLQLRVISMNMIAQGRLIVVQIQNYFSGERHFVDGLPLTTKAHPQDHGFGMKSIRFTAEKYNGTISIHIEDTVFTLQILLPAP